MSELSTVGLFILSPTGSVVEANDTWYSLTGLTRDDDERRSWMDSVADESKDDMQRGWHILTVEHKAWSGELKMTRPWFDVEGQRQPSWTLAAAHPEFNASGAFVGVMFSMTEISHLKWAQALQTRRLEEAEEQRRQQNNFIDITSHEMRNPLSAILQCADDVSAAMKELLKSSDFEITTEIIQDCKDAAETIAFCAQHQKSIVDDILTISKLDSDLLVMTPSVVQPLALTQRACKMFEADASKKGIKLTFDMHSTYQQLAVDFATLDANRVMQVLINLLTNAIKFTQTEPVKKIVVKISAFLQPPSHGIPGFTYVPTKSSLESLTRITDKQDWGSGQPIYIGFVVEDTGRGLTADEKKTLFMRFSQASPRTHAQYGGSGLGLFISRQLTELHGGRIGVSSTYGVGSSFGFYVRARKASRELGEDLDSTLEPSLRDHKKVSSQEDSTAIKQSISQRVERSNLQLRRRVSSNPKKVGPEQTNRPEEIWILVVEDNMVNQKVLRKQLEQLKYHVSVANNGQEALDHLEDTARWYGKTNGQPLSLILMDLEMPVMNGEEATKNIRLLEAQGKFLGRVPIIAVSANVRLEQINAARESGMVSNFLNEMNRLMANVHQDSVVSKPFRIPELIAKINEVLVSQA